jgi:hypothetical protein
MFSSQGIRAALAALALLIATAGQAMEMDAMPDHGDAGHGDHAAKFGGRVLMYGDLHFEVVARPAGGVELHLSDAMRTPLPAVTVSDVNVELERSGAFEPVAMAVSDAGDHWNGASGPLDDPENTTVHLAFVAFGEAIMYALPLSALQQETEEEASVADMGASDAR